MPNGPTGAGQPPQAGQVAPPQGQPAVNHATPPPTTSPDPQPAAGQGAAPTTPAPQPASTQGNQGTQGGDGDGIQPAEGGFLVRSDAFKRIKDRSRERGKQEGLEELAQAKGFESVEAMNAALDGNKPGAGNSSRTKPRRRRKKRTGGDDRSANARSNNMPKPNGQQDPAADAASDGGAQQPDIKQLTQSIRRMERRLERSEGKNTDLSKRMRRESNARKKLRRERDALEAEMIVREVAARIGIQDVDYAMRLLTRELQGKSMEDLEGFDENKFFDGLREKHSYLFGERSQPATTGNSAGDSQGGAPNPGAAANGAAQGGQVDVRKMDEKQYREHLAKRGLQLGV